MKKHIHIILSFTLMSSLLTACSKSEYTRDTVYEDMKSSFEASGLYSSNIGIFSRTESDGSVSYGEGGSGVIIERDGSQYYALTAAHVVSVPDSQLLVYTVNTEMKTEEIPGIDMNVLAEEVYETMIPAETVFVSSKDDLAVITFSCDENLSVAEIADANPAKDDRIMCVGNPQNEWFRITYGKVTSGIEKFGESLGYPSNVMRHSAYINIGSSGGGAFNEEMKLVGITPGASISPDGKDFKFGVLIPAEEISLCLVEWN